MTPDDIPAEPLADSVATAARRLSIGMTALYEEIKTGRLRVRKMGRRTLVPRVEQERWLTALPLHEPGPAGAPDPRLSQMSEAELRAVIEQATAAA